MQRVVHHDDVRPVLIDQAQKIRVEIYEGKNFKVTISNAEVSISKMVHQYPIQ